MFATLLGPLPRPLLPADAPVGALIQAAVAAQEAAGLEPVTDGGVPATAGPVAGWEATARLTDRAVKQAIRGPYTRGRAGAGAPAQRTAATLTHAAALNAALRDLSAAGCPLIEVHEPAAIAIGADPAERSLFREAHLRLLDGLEGTHLSLAITGGSADGAGIETILAAPYASLAVDLIAGPDNWRLVAVTPGELGVVCGALSPLAGSDDGPELLLWAAGYAASTRGRGPERVGLATASSLADLPWADAIAKLERLGAAAGLAVVPRDEAVASLDPRAVSSRSAALGHAGPPPSRLPRRGQDPT